MRVLLATDGSRSSEEAAAFLARLPHRERLQLTIVTAVAPPSSAFFSPTKEFMEQLAKDDRKSAETHQLRTREDFLGANAEVETVVLDGSPQEKIVDYATTHDIDLIVMGAKGHSKVDRILLGSTSDYVATHAPCSVLVVRPGDSPNSGVHAKLRVAVAFDATPASQSAIDELLRFDWGANTQISVVGVSGFSPIFDSDYGFNPAVIREQAEVSLHRASRQLQEKVAQADNCLIEHDHVAEGLVRFTEEQGMDFIVVGETGRSRLARALLGSVSRYVLRHAKCGVWITRNPKRTESVGGLKDQVGKMSGAT